MRVLCFSLGLIVAFGSVGAAMQMESRAPFTAEYETIKVVKQANGGEVVQRDHGRVCRDGRGRMRYEFVEDETPIAFLVDPATDRIAVIDVSSGQTFDAPSGRARVSLEPKITPRLTTEDSSRGGEQFRPVESSSLGERVIEGLVSRGHRVRLANGSVAEVWHAVAIPGIPISSTATGPSGAEESHLHNIQLGEPDPHLFEPLDIRK